MFGQLNLPGSERPELNRDSSGHNRRSLPLDDAHALETLAGGDFHPSSVSGSTAWFLTCENQEDEWVEATRLLSVLVLPLTATDPRRSRAWYSLASRQLAWDSNPDDPKGRTA